MIFQQTFRGGVTLAVYDREDEGPVPLCLPRQVHGTRVVEMRTPREAAVEADALYTRRNGVFVGVQTADCLPLLIWDDSLVGAVHAGWRGLSAGILEAFVRETSLSGDAHVFVGPAVAACCYPVGEEVASRFPGHVRDDGHLDLRAAAVERLLQIGVRGDRISHLARCTSCGGEDLPSYRRDGTAASRIISAIGRLPTG